MPRRHHAPTPHDLRRVAVAAAIDPRSVLRVLLGEPVRALTLTRIAGALGVTPAAAPRAIALALAPHNATADLARSAAMETAGAGDDPQATK